MVSASRFCVLPLYVASLCVNLLAQERCDVEAKLLLVPTQVQAAVPLLHGERESQSRIYFYDTPALDMLSQGVILRLRQGADDDLTVKLRPPVGKRFSDPSNDGDRFKCEAEMTNGVEAPSYSVQAEYVATRVPEAGKELLALLSPAQKKLLDDSHVPIDWTKVKRVADIRSTSWSARAQGPLGKLSLELWEWPTGRIFEVSTKVKSSSGRAAYTEMEGLMKEKGLALSAVQQSKTATALREMNPVRVR